jgi:hypothetical protein
MAAGSGIPDYQRAARVIIKDYAVGRLLYCHAPPNTPDLKAFLQETVATALHNTKKLRDKLQLQQNNDPKTGSDQDSISRNDSDDNDDDVSARDDDDNMVDDDLLELIGQSAPSGAGNSSLLDSKTHRKSSSQNKKGKTPKQKWGKKDRKNRNKDPYGCQSTPDSSLFDAGGGGVVVNAGKYSRGGYTRPSTYPVAR